MALHSRCCLVVLFVLVVLQFARATSRDGELTFALTRSGDEVLEPVLSAIQPDYLSNADTDDSASSSTTTIHTSEITPTRKRGKKRKGRKKNAGVDVSDGIDGADILDVTDDTVLDEEGLDGNATVNLNNSELAVPRIPYTHAPVNSSYVAQEHFSPQGMEHLYYITDLFLNLMHREEQLPPVLGEMLSREIEQPTLDAEQGTRMLGWLASEWDVLLVHYVGIVGLLLLGLLLAAILPLVGLCLLCCRCAGKCGASEIVFDKKHDPCKRVTLTAFMIALLVLALLGVVCAFVSNSRVEDGVQSLPGNLHDAVHDSELFLNNTDLEVHAIFVTNYGELQDVLFHKLDTSGELVKHELARVTRAVAIDNLTAIAISLAIVRQDLLVLRNTTRGLQEVTQYLRSGLESVAARLRKHQQTCASQPECEQLQQDFIERLHINTDFTQLPKVEHKLQEVELLLEADIEAEVKRGKRAFDSIATEIQNKVQQSIPEIKDKIRQAGAQLQQAASQVREVLAGVDVRQHTDPPIAYLRDITRDYAYYRYYAFLAVCCALLIVLASWVLAVMYGCCGRRADEAASCLKMTGATWMMTGVFLFFLFGSVLLVVTAALFVVGSLARLLVCESLTGPSSSEVFTALHSHLNIRQHYPQDEAPTLMEIIERCHRNESIYSVLSLHLLDDSLTSLLQYRDRLHLDEKVAQLKQEISVDTNVKILSRDAKQQLRALANSSLARRDDWADYAEILEQQVLTTNLLEMAAQLNQTADQLPAGYEEVSIGLKNDALFLESLQRWLVAIRGDLRRLKETTARLSEHLHFDNHTTLRPAIRRLISQAEYAQRYLRTNGSHEVVLLVERFSADFLSDVDSYVAHVQAGVQNGLGRCAPLSQAYNATTAAFCKDVLYPFNGFWVSVGWVFVVFVPCVILAVHLTGLYRKTEPWPGPLHESAYDKKPQRSHELEAGSSNLIAQHNYNAAHPQPPLLVGFTGPAARHEHPPIDSGPPRYTSQPSLSPEYERPPPYYYPGPGHA